MKKILALVLAAMLLMGMCSALAEAPEGYPEKIEGLDFGGRTVYIYDWWGNDDAEHSTRNPEPDPETQALYDYRDWLEETYNVKIVETALSDWGGNPTELTNINMNGGLNGKGDEGDWCIIAIAADFAPSTLKNDLYMPWQIDLSGEKWNPVTNKFMTKADGKVYGVHVGKTEPRSCLFFNKRVLEEAGIDWNTIYDMQADGTWTWEAWENIMAQVQRDTDNDGVIDIYGLTGSGDDMAVALSPWPLTARLPWTLWMSASRFGTSTPARRPKAPTGTGSRPIGKKAPPRSTPARPGRASTTVLKWMTCRTSGAL